MAVRSGGRPHLALLRGQRLRYQEDDEHKVEQAHRGSDVHGRAQPVLGVEERRDGEAEDERACGPGTHCKWTRRAARSLVDREPGGPGAWWVEGLVGRGPTFAAGAGFPATDTPWKIPRLTARRSGGEASATYALHTLLMPGCVHMQRLRMAHGTRCACLVRAQGGGLSAGRAA